MPDPTIRNLIAESGPMIDLDEIRHALAAATPPRDENAADDWYRWHTTRSDLMPNAPTWLAQLCDEIERLRADIAIEADYTAGLEDNREAWRACADQLVADLAAIRFKGHLPALARFDALKAGESWRAER